MSGIVTGVEVADAHPPTSIQMNRIAGCAKSRAIVVQVPVRSGAMRDRRRVHPPLFGAVGSPKRRHELCRNLILRNPTLGPVRLGVTDTAGSSQTKGGGELIVTLVPRRGGIDLGRSFCNKPILLTRYSQSGYPLVCRYSRTRARK